MKPRFSEEQIIDILKQQESGVTTYRPMSGHSNIKIVSFLLVYLRGEAQVKSTYRHRRNLKPT